jgi:hypothetical protein
LETGSGFGSPIVRAMYVIKEEVILFMIQQSAAWNSIHQTNAITRSIGTSILYSKVVHGVVQNFRAPPILPCKISQQTALTKMDRKVEAFYREIYRDLKVDDNEASRLTNYFSRLNPPPDKLLWLRSTAFRLACDFLSDDNKDKNVALLKCINYIVHSIETLCMMPVLPEGNSEYDAEQTEEFFQEIYSDLGVDRTENQELREFFEERIPPSDSLVTMRAAAFKSAIAMLSEDDTDSNISLLRCINSVVNNFELTCYK